MARSADAIFDADTELGRHLAAVDWAATPLGPVETWPTSLRNVVSLQLGSRFAMWMAWGPELTFLCNDAYRRSTLAGKYPWALGKPAREVWSEIWPDIGPRIESVVTTGVATWDESLLLFLERSGYQEETYHTFSYSPLTDDAGAIAGMLCVVSEETARVISERRMTTVRELSTALASASTVDEVWAAAGGRLALDGRNVPFALGYTFADDRDAHLAFSVGVPAGHPIAPKTINTGDRGTLWPADRLRHGLGRLVEDLDVRYPDLRCGEWGEPVSRALVLPFTQLGRDEPHGFLVAGLTRYRNLDDDVRSFLELLAAQIAAAISRAQAFEQERRRAEDLAELDRAKTTFFTNVSHELRTPLTLLLGPAADALEDDKEPLPGVQRRRVEVIARNGERLLKLVNTLLDFSRIEAGNAEPRFEPLDLARYTAELTSMFESVMTRAGLALTIECRPLPRRAYVDPEMWAKIVLNLLSNALKATFDGGVTVRFGERDGWAELAVRDTGVGIPAGEQARLFERFHRVVGAQLRTHEGSGIGLALVAELAALHGGAVAVQSTPGEGSEFVVRIPIGTEHLPAEQVRDDTSDEPPPVEQYSVGYLTEADRWLSGDETLASVGNGTDRPTVLVVDDNADMREYISGLLHDEYAVRTAVDGAHALDLALVQPPDLVLTDVMMPRLDGFGLLAELRANPDTLHVPVVMLSARSGDDAAVVGLEAGADDYLVKPFSARELRARVRANLELDRVRRVADELARSRTLLDQAEELAHVGSWELDLVDRSVIGSPEFVRIVGISADEVTEGGLARLLDRTHAADRDRITDALDNTARTGEPFDIEAIFVRGDGAERLMRAHGVLARGRAGNAVLRGSMQDITEQRAAEQELAASAAAREVAAREHEIADELQRSLLPASMPSPASLQTAAYYVAGVEHTHAGGDWYDVVELPGGRTALIVGDVMGRGVRAAAVMGQLRATIRAYARLDVPPERVLALLDAEVRDTTDAMIVTCVYAVYDPASATLIYGNAGHLPPLLTMPDGATVRLIAGDPPLGTGRYQGNLETVAWPVGARLTLYTDGLVEHRGSDLDVGITSLAAALSANADLPVEALPDAIAGAVLSHQPDDDVAILVAEARRPDSVGVSMTVPVLPIAVAEVRRQVEAVLAQLDLGGDLADDVLLVVSELVTNAIRYGRAPVQFAMRCTDREVVVEVADTEHAIPQMRDFDPAAASGRGLHLVESLGARWGARPTGVGKSVWCLIPLPDAQR